MIYDAGTKTTKDQVLLADICIIGTGAAGLPMAHYLKDWAKKNNKKIIVLESSRVSDPQQHSPAVQPTLHKTELLTGIPNRRFADPFVQPLCYGPLTSDAATAGGLYDARVRCYGGTTNCWGGWTTPLADVDFDRQDINPQWLWPFKMSELQPWYNKAMEYCSVQPSADALPEEKWDVGWYSKLDDWEKVAPGAVATLPDIATYELSSAALLQINGGAEYGVNGRLDFQLVWGPELELETCKEVEIWRNANVRFVHAFSGVVAEVVVTTVTPDGKRGHDFKVKPKNGAKSPVVVAAGCIETARLLLHSKITNAFLGRYLNTHPLIVNAATFERGERDATYEQNRFYSGTAPLGKGPYQPSIFGAIVPKPEALKGIGNFRARIDFNNGTVNFNWEKFPDYESTITLDTATPDRLFGDPRAKVSISVSDLDRKTLDEGLARVGKMLEDKKYAAKGSFKRTTEPVLLPMEHLMGATRMSAGTSGVVDAWGTVKSISNLYAASTSVFPTGGWANPTLTLIAFALRQAEHLKSRA